MNRLSQVGKPPAKPRLLYDGDCQFCTLWIHRWQLVTRDFVECLPFQDPRGAAQFPEISRAQFEAAVQLVMPDGSVFRAAEAVCRSLACHPEEQWLLELYQHSRALAGVLETSYRFVARHRPFFSALTRLFWGRHLEPPRQNLVRWIFLRGLGVIYLAAFVSLWMQMGSLAGSTGTSPVSRTLDAAKEHYTALGVGLDRLHQLPTLCWFSASEGFLNLQCAAGTMLAGLLLCGIAPAPCLFLLWLIYLSLATVCAGAAGFPGGNLLLETGFLAIFFAPLQLLPRAPAGETPPSRIALWLLRWLLFRLLFESGCGQLLMSHGAWPPNFFGAVVLAMKLLLPWAIFLPRQPRQVAGVLLIAWQWVSLPMGGHPLFNLLTIALCLTLFDDATVQGFFPKQVQAHRWLSVQAPRMGHRWPWLILALVVVLVGCGCYAHVFQIIGIHMPGPEPVMDVARWLEPFRSINNYRLAP